MALSSLWLDESARLGWAGLDQNKYKSPVLREGCIVLAMIRADLIRTGGQQNRKTDFVSNIKVRQTHR